MNIAVNDLTITSISAATKIPNLLVNRGLTLHTPLKCLSCFKVSKKTKYTATPKGSPIPKRLREVMDSFNVNQNESDKSKANRTDSSDSSNGATDPNRTQDLIPDNPMNTNASESAEDGRNNDNIVMEVIRRKEVLKLVGCMNATVGAKTAEQGLLRYCFHLCMISICWVINSHFSKYQCRLIESII